MTQTTKFHIKLIVFMLVIFSVIGFVVLVISEKMNKNGDNVKKNGFTADVEIVQVETFGEVHDYLYYREIYRGSLTHLPNCRFCTKLRDTNCTTLIKFHK